MVHGLVLTLPCARQGPPAQAPKPRLSTELNAHIGHRQWAGRGCRPGNLGANSRLFGRVAAGPSTHGGIMKASPARASLYAEHMATPDFADRLPLHDRRHPPDGAAAYAGASAEAGLACGCCRPRKRARGRAGRGRLILPRPRTLQPSAGSSRTSLTAAIRRARPDQWPPYASLVCAGSDGHNAARQIERIPPAGAAAWPSRSSCAPCAEPQAILAPKQIRDEELVECRALGAARLRVWAGGLLAAVPHGLDDSTGAVSAT